MARLLGLSPIERHRGCGGLGLGYLLALCLLLASSAFADDQGKDQGLGEKLKQIRASVESAESDIGRMKDEFNALLLKRQKLEQALKKLREEDTAMQTRVSELKGEQAELEAEVVASEKRASDYQRKLQSRLRAIYINASVSANPAVSRQAGRGDLERLSLYSRKVRDLDSLLFKQASDAVLGVRQSQSALAQVVEAEQRLQDELQKKRRDAEGQAAKIKVVTQQLIEKQERAQMALALLQEEAAKVEDMIASLTSGPEEDKEEEELEEDLSEEEPAQVKDGQKPKEVVQESAPKSIIHPSLFDGEIKVSSPVKGEVLQGFGRSKITNFADIVRSKGIEFSTESGRDIHVVLAGKVVFAGVMPGYDQVIVIEHGGRSYSLYGRLGSTAVQTGSLVEQDQVIATSSSPDEKGRNFYFEVRKNGQPVNPETVLAKLSR